MSDKGMQNNKCFSLYLNILLQKLIPFLFSFYFKTSLLNDSKIILNLNLKIRHYE